MLVSCAKQTDILVSLHAIAVHTPLKAYAGARSQNSRTQLATRVTLIGACNCKLLPSRHERSEPGWQSGKLTSAWLGLW